MKNFPGMHFPTLTLDFDGVIHSYTSGWKGARIIPDPPVPGVGEFIVKAMTRFQIAVFSSRSHQWEGRRAMRKYVEKLLTETCFDNFTLYETARVAHLGRPSKTPYTLLQICNEMIELFECIQFPLFKPASVVSLDDRALTFDGTWPSVESLVNFKPWDRK